VKIFIYPIYRKLTENLQGTGIYAYCILSAGTFTNLTFILDGNDVGNFAQTPDNSSTFYYGTPVYANASLPNSEHTLLMAAGGPTKSLFLFDYAEYT
jgi:hypothetical protein